MFHPDQVTATTTPMPSRSSPTRIRACLVPGCPCKDARIVSQRRAAFFAAMARRTARPPIASSPPIRPGCCRSSRPIDRRHA